MSEEKRMFKIVFSPAGFLNFCRNFCPALSKILKTDIKIVTTGLKFLNFF